MPQLIHTCFWVGDLAKSISFYELLGFEQWMQDQFRDVGPYAFLGLPGDGPRLELNSATGVTSYEVGTGYRHIAVVVDDMSATLALLAGAGYTPNDPPMALPEAPGTSVCYVRDPDNYEIELWAPKGPELPLPPSARAHEGN